MKFTVIIPTRERLDTLYYTLKTCVTQDYDNLAILVSDNFSEDNTRDVVHSFEDKRIRYINAGKRVSMSSNWEFALDHVNDGYFTFVADDDGLLSNAVKDVKNIIFNSGVKAVAWSKAEYTWPTLPEINDLLSIPLRNRLIICPAKKMTNHYGMIGGAIVWAVLHMGYVLISIRIMHLRILKGELWRWYLYDVGLPLIVSLAIGVSFSLMLPTQLTRIEVVIFLVLVTAISVGACILVTSILRSALLVHISVLRSGARQRIFKVSV